MDAVQGSFSASNTVQRQHKQRTCTGASRSSEELGLKPVGSKPYNISPTCSLLVGSLKGCTEFDSQDFGLLQQLSVGLRVYVSHDRNVSG